MPRDGGASLATKTLRFYLGLFTGIICLHVVLYAVDSRVQIFLDDSISYLSTAVLKYIPQDRSFFYGLVIRFITQSSQNLASLVGFQILLFCLSSLIFAVILREYFKISDRLVLSVTLIATLLPLHMIWTRYVMTESAALFLFSLFILFSLEYLRSGRLYLLLLLHIAGILGIAFRSIMIPPAIIVPLILPIFYYAACLWQEAGPDMGGLMKSARGNVGRFMTHMVISLALLLSLHGWYQTYYAYELNARLSQDREQRSPEAYQNGFPFGPAYSYGSGYFLLGFVAPLVEPEHFLKSIDGNEILAGLGKNTEDRQNRIYHRWSPNGLIVQTRLAVIDAAPPGMSADRAARIIATRAIRQNPKKFLYLGISTLFDYWNTELVRDTVERDLGLNRTPDDWTENFMLENFHLYINPKATELTFLKSAYLATLPYAQLLAFGFILIPISLALHDRKTWLYMFTLCGILLYLNLTLFIFAEGPNVRYLQSVSWVFMIIFVASFRVDRDRAQYFANLARSFNRRGNEAST